LPPTSAGVATPFTPHRFFKTSAIYESATVCLLEASTIRVNNHSQFQAIQAASLPGLPCGHGEGQEK
jgi:hypothetical protein